jgi:hypothetical protein
MLAAHDDPLMLQALGDGALVDLELCGEFVDRSPRRIVLYRVFKLRGVELQGLSRVPSRRSPTARAREIEVAVSPKPSTERRRGRVRERSHEDHQSNLMRTVNISGFPCSTLRAAPPGYPNARFQSMARD